MKWYETPLTAQWDVALEKILREQRRRMNVYGLNFNYRA